MADAPRTGPPPEKEAAAQVSGPGQRRDFDNGSDSQQNTTTKARAEAGSTIDRKRLWEMARALMPRGELRRDVPKHPAWCRRIGDDVCFRLMLDRDPDPTEVELLRDAHARATARRDHERQAAAEERELRALARSLMRGQRVLPNALGDIPVGGTR